MESNNVIDFVLYKEIKKLFEPEQTFDDYGFTPEDYERMKLKGGPIIDHWERLHAPEIETKYVTSANGGYIININAPEANNS